MTEDRKKDENSFRNILKGTSLFGGVQVFNIIISAIRLKFVAVILGPAGMGTAGLFNTASLTIQQFASLGLNLAIVKDIGHNKDNRECLSDVLGAIRPLILLSAILGALVCLMFPGLLSSITFGNHSYTGAFRLLSAAVFFSIAGSALMSVLQGLHAVKPLSRASVIGSVVGLIVGVPLYWLLGTDGIVPAMAALALCTCLWYFLSLRKTLSVRPAAFTREVHLPMLKRILAMGIILMSNDLFRNLANYILYIFVRSHGGETEVGFYQSCNTMTSQYSAIVFTAMAMDYLPRLSASAGDDVKMCSVVNRQMEVVSLLIAPIACAVILLAPTVIEILQTEKFLTAVPLLRLLAAAVVLQAIMYPLGYIVFAKDNRRLFFWMESVGANLLTLGLSCGGYRLFGLNGLGYSAITDCAICLCVYIAVNRRLYGYKISRQAKGITALAITSTATMTAICFLLHGALLWICSLMLLAAVCVSAGKGLWQRLRK
ncbi:MAG: oligosaccharide flippase family protein [Muribaculaceae bacterium]|nr:oligosaccharide flippase family protein [Muribaculaceae bacterium]